MDVSVKNCPHETKIGNRSTGVINCADCGRLLQGVLLTPDARRFQSEPEYWLSLVRGVQKKHKISQRDLAALIGVGLSTLRDWQHGRATPNYPAQYTLECLL